MASELSSFLTLGLFTRSFSFLSYFTLLLFSSLNELGWVDTQMAHSFKDGSRLLVILSVATANAVVIKCFRN